MKYLMLCLLAILAGCSSKWYLPAEERTAPEHILKAEGPRGTPVYLDYETCMAVDRAYQESLHASDSAKRSEAGKRFQGLAFGPKAFFLMSDTKIRILKGSSSESLKVRILDGTHAGNTGWLGRDRTFLDNRTIKR